MNQEEIKPVEEKEKDMEAEGPAVNNEDTEGQGSESPVQEGESKAELALKSLQEKYNELNDKYLRLYSEFENYRKRTSKERIELYQTAGLELLQSLLPVMDDFERAMKAAEASQDLKGLKEGVAIIYQKFDKFFQQNGVKVIESPVGKNFDLNYHEAITKIDAPEEKLKGKVIDELEKGYMLNDKVIRYTKVVIGQ